MTIADIEQEIISDFELFDTWDEKYNYIIEMGKSLEPMPEQFKTEDYLIKGCQSKVWLFAKKDEQGKIVYFADSDAIIPKGIIALLMKIFNHQLPQDIINTNLTLIDKIGLKEHLSPTRSNGLLAMLKQIKYYAIALNQ